MTDASPFFYYSDDKIYLRPLRRSDLAGRWPEWFNDSSVTQFTSMGYFPNTAEAQQSYFERISQSSTDVVLAVVERATDRHVGNIGLHRIEPIHRTAYLGIVIGERNAQGKGIGAKSWQAITNYGFEILNLHKICATVIDGNEASLKCALRAGYVVEGRQASQVYKNGAFRDLIYVGLLREAWKAGATSRAR